MHREYIGRPGEGIKWWRVKNLLTMFSTGLRIRSGAKRRRSEGVCSQLAHNRATRRTVPDACSRIRSVGAHAYYRLAEELDQI